MVLREQGSDWCGDSSADTREILAHPWHGGLRNRSYLYFVPSRRMRRMIT
jgi:hypothetical protein